MFQPTAFAGPDAAAATDPPAPIAASTSEPIEAPGSEPNEPVTEPGAETVDDGPAEGDRELAEEVLRQGFRATFRASQTGESAWRQLILRGLQDRQRVPSGPGIYIVADAKGNAIYVGKARDLRGRWSGRLLAMDQVGLLPLAADRGIRVWFGTLADRRASDTILLGLEHAIIRVLERGGLAARLRNRSSALAFHVAPDLQDIVIDQPLPPHFAAQLQRNGLHPASFVNGILRIPKGTRLFEFGGPAATPWVFQDR